MKFNQETMEIFFFIFIIILAVFPKQVHHFYKSMLGRLVLISIVVYFTVNNMTLGLLMALVIIAASNQFKPFVEGMTTPKIVGEDNEEKEEKEEKGGVSKEDIKIAVTSKASNSIPVSTKVTSNEEVSASTESMLNPSVSEGFANIRI
jgi:hypothetical protein